MPSPKPRLALVAITKRPWFDGSYKPLLKALYDKADILEITNADAASTLFNGSERPVALVIDSTLTEAKHAPLRAEVRAHRIAISITKDELTKL